MAYRMLAFDYDGTLAALEEAKRAGFLLGLVTGRPRKEAKNQKAPFSPGWRRGRRKKGAACRGDSRQPKVAHGRRIPPGRLI